MNKENGIKRLNRLSAQAKEYRDENTQVVKLSQAIEVVELIDEPKLLSEEWIMKHREWATLPGGKNTNVVKTAWLRDMAVWEPEKPFVPQFVADWIEKEKRAKSQLHSVISTSLNYSNHVENWIDWCKNNKKFTETIARAWLNGYEVVKESLFHMPVPYLEDAYYRNDDLKELTSFKKYSKFTQTELDERFPDIKHMAVEVQG